LNVVPYFDLPERIEVQPTVGTTRKNGPAWCMIRASAARRCSTRASISFDRTSACARKIALNSAPSLAEILPWLMPSKIKSRRHLDVQASTGRFGKHAIKDCERSPALPFLAEPDDAIHQPLKAIAATASSPYGPTSPGQNLPSTSSRGASRAARCLAN
jgi:hypothetical protein